MADVDLVYERYTHNKPKKRGVDAPSEANRERGRFRPADCSCRTSDKGQQQKINHGNIDGLS